MSIQLRVAVELSESTTGEVHVRTEQIETLVVSTEVPGDDAVLLTGAVLERMLAYVGRAAGEQMRNLHEIQAAVGGSKQ